MNLILSALIGLAPLAAQAAAPAPSPSLPRLSPQNTALVRCAAAFALVAYDQENGGDTVRKWPPIDPRGREFFVRALAQVMDETGMDREAVAGLVEGEARSLLDQGQVDQVMPACLLMLDASGIE